jgi:hypothetical protein
MFPLCGAMRFIILTVIILLATVAGCSLERLQIPLTGSAIQENACKDTCEQEKNSYFPEDANVKTTASTSKGPIGECNCQYAYFKDGKQTEGWMGFEDFTNWYTNQ